MCDLDFEAGAQGKSRRLRRIAPSLLGLFGSVTALLYSLSFIGNNGAGCACNWAFIQTFLGWPMLAGSVIGFIGSGLYPALRRTSGVMLLIAGALVTPLAFFCRTWFMARPWCTLSRWHFLCAELSSELLTTTCGTA